MFSYVIFMLIHHTFIHYLNPQGRFDTWKKAIEFWHGTKGLIPWTGIGLGLLESGRLRGTFGMWASFHNEPIQVLVELGIVGLTLSLGMVSSLVIRLFKSVKETTLIAWIGSAVSFSIVACFGFPLRIGTTLLIGVLIVAALESLMELGGSNAKTQYSA